MKEFNIEQLKQRMKEAQEKIQNDFIDKIYSDIEFLLEKANRSDYEVTQHEKEVFNRICVIINNMKTWF